MKTITAIICITAITLYAQYCGQDTLMVKASIAIIAGLGGFAVGVGSHFVRKGNNH